MLRVYTLHCKLVYVTKVDLEPGLTKEQAGREECRA